MTPMKKRLVIGTVVIAALAGLWNYLSGDKAPEKSADVTAQRDSRGRTPEQKAVAVALAPVLLSYQNYLETDASKLFPDETPANATMLGKRLTRNVILESRNAEEAFSKRDGKTFTISASDIKNRGTKDKSYSVTMTIDPAKGEISQTVDGKQRPSFKIDTEKAAKLRNAVEPAKQSFNSIAPAQGLVTVPSLAQLAAPVEAKQLPAAPAVRQIVRRSGPLGMA